MSASPAVSAKSSIDEFTTILGIRFYTGDLPGLLERCQQGGLIVVPAAPALVDLPADSAYRAALEGSEFAITDSGFMVLLWALFKGVRLRRISGLKLLRGLITLQSFRAPGVVLGVMPSPADAQANCAWLKTQGIALDPAHQYLAPEYRPGPLEDPALLAAIETLRPVFVLINLGGGVQERLGFYLRQRLSYRPAIVCTGAAIAFLSGRQANIPPWADRLFLGWLARCLREPRKFIPRYWKALRLAPLVWKYGASSVAGAPKP